MHYEKIITVIKRESLVESDQFALDYNRFIYNKYEYNVSGSSQIDNYKCLQLIVDWIN